MRALRSLLVFGSLVAVPCFFVACGGDTAETSGTSGTGGSAGTGSTGAGATGSGTAGTTGAGATGSGTAGTTGSGAAGTTGAGATGGGTAGTTGAGATGSGTAGTGGGPTGGTGGATGGTSGTGATGGTGGTGAGAASGAAGSPASCVPGASQPAPDGCNTCICQADGSWACTEKGCVSECSGKEPPCQAPPPGCEYVGGGCVNSQWTCGDVVCQTECKADPDCPAIKMACHDCPSGGVSCPSSNCVNGACDIVWSACGGIAPGLACTDPGTTAPADDGCNTCACGKDLKWSCTKKACPPTCDGPIIDCAAPPPGCNYVGGGCGADGNWTCGTLVCEGQCQLDKECPPTKIACKACVGGGYSCPEPACLEGACGIVWTACQGVAPGLSCDKPGATSPADDGCNTCVCNKQKTWSCTKKACPACDGPQPPCAPPPAGCDYVGGGCGADGNWTCGTLECKNQCKQDSDCPQLGAPCQQCPDGSSACPTSTCVNGMCQSSFPSCK
jgi:hypothetical protein